MVGAKRVATSIGGRLFSTASTTASSSSKIPLLFLGANGFPAQVYTPTLKILLDSLGRSPAVSAHDAQSSSSSLSTLTALDYHPSFAPHPPTWDPVIAHVTSAAAALSARSGNQPIVAVGHSAGGALLLASVRRAPHLYKGVVMVDPPLFSAARRFLFSLGFLLPSAILEKAHPLIKSAVTKRDSWASLTDAEAWMEGNRLFKTFHPDVRRAFLAHGFVPSGSGVTLAFTKRQEANMYLTTPMETGIGDNGKSVGQYGAGGFPVGEAKGGPDPRGVYFYSTQHKFSPKEDIDFLKSPKGLGQRADGAASKEGGCEFKGFEQGHFWPLEDPADFGVKVAAAVKSIADSSP